MVTSGATERAFPQIHTILTGKAAWALYKGEVHWKITSQVHILQVSILSSLPPLPIFHPQHTEQSICDYSSLQNSQHHYYQPFKAVHSCQTLGVSWIPLFCPHHLNTISFCYCLLRMSITCLVLFFLAQSRCSINICYQIKPKFLLS